MPHNFYTFLIIPKKRTSAKKFIISSTLLKGLVCCLIVIILSSMYAYYDYITIKRDRTEPERLRKQTKE